MLACLLEAKAKAAGLDITVSSAGVAAGEGMPASSHSISCMEERGLDLSKHSSTPAARIALGEIDQFHCMSENHAFALFDAGIQKERLFVVNAENGGVPDPFGGDRAIYEHTAQVLEQAAQDIVTALQEGATDA